MVNLLDDFSEASSDDACRAHGGPRGSQSTAALVADKGETRSTNLGNPVRDEVGAKSQTFRRRVHVGKGVWGSKLERSAAAARAREGKARKRHLKDQQEKKSLEKKIATVRGNGRKGGNRFCRKVSYDAMREIAFATAARRFGDTAAIHRVSRRSVRDVSFVLGSLYLRLQSLLMGCIVWVRPAKDFLGVSIRGPY